jgi:hypothetical protein
METLIKISIIPLWSAFFGLFMGNIMDKFPESGFELTWGFWFSLTMLISLTILALFVYRKDYKSILNGTYSIPIMSDTDIAKYNLILEKKKKNEPISDFEKIDYDSLNNKYKFSKKIKEYFEYEKRNKFTIRESLLIMILVPFVSLYFEKKKSPKIIKVNTDTKGNDKWTLEGATLTFDSEPNEPD